MRLAVLPQSTEGQLKDPRTGIGLRSVVYRKSQRSPMKHLLTLVATVVLAQEALAEDKATSLPAELSQADIAGGRRPTPPLFVCSLQLSPGF